MYGKSLVVANDKDWHSSPKRVKEGSVLAPHRGPTYVNLPAPASTQDKNGDLILLSPQPVNTLWETTGLIMFCGWFNTAAYANGNGDYIIAMAEHESVKQLPRLFVDISAALLIGNKLHYWSAVRNIGIVSLDDPLWFIDNPRNTPEALKQANTNLKVFFDTVT